MNLLCELFSVLLLQRFTQYLASNNCSFNLGSFVDKQGVQGMCFYSPWRDISLNIFS